MRIVIETRPHSEQRYETSGDWWEQRTLNLDGSYDEQLNVRVSAMGDWRYEALVGIHEAIEAVLCRQAGISEEAVTAFDEAYEAARESGAPVPFCGCMPTDESEPGDDAHAPYQRQHAIATGIERILAAELGIAWATYEEANLALYRE